MLREQLRVTRHEALHFSKGRLVASRALSVLGIVYRALTKIAELTRYL